MKKKITVLALCATALCALLVPLRRSSRQRYPRSAYLGARYPLQLARIESFRREFSELGYVEGKNIAFEYRFAENKLDRLPALADELVRLKVDVIVTPGANDSPSRQERHQDDSHRFSATVILLRLGWSTAWRVPGATSQGSPPLAAVLAGKRLELLKETVPKLSRVAVLWDPQNRRLCAGMERKPTAGTRTGLQLHSMEVEQRRQIRQRVQRGG